MEEKKASKKQMSKGKKAIINLLAVALIIGVTVAVTLALLSTTSDQKVNTFTASSDIKLGLDEPNYNLNDNGTVKNKNKPNPGNYQPGTSYDKDPTLYNLSGGNLTSDSEVSEEWVAMRVDYKIGSTKKTYTEMTTNDTSVASPAGIIEEITFDRNNWIEITDSKCSDMPSNAQYSIYVYKYKLQAKKDVTTIANAQTNGKVASSTQAGIRTTSLFKATGTATVSQISIKSQEQLIKNGYATNNLPTFKIILNGGAIKNQTDIDTAASGISSINENNLGSANTAKNDYKIVSELVKLLKGITVN